LNEFGVGHEQETTAYDYRNSVVILKIVKPQNLPVVFNGKIVIPKQARNDNCNSERALTCSPPPRNIFPHARHHHIALPNRRKTRRRWYGGGL
jgi:hypothetical protein